LKNLVFPFKFFRVLRKKFFKKKSKALNELFINKLTFLKNNFDINNIKNYLIKKTNINFFDRTKSIINLSKNYIYKIKSKNLEKKSSLSVNFNNFINNKFFKKFNIKNNLLFSFKKYKIKYKTQLIKYKTILPVYKKNRLKKIIKKINIIKYKLVKNRLIKHKRKKFLRKKLIKR
jgi:hypothetical protein